MKTKVIYLIISILFAACSTKQDSNMQEYSKKSNTEKIQKYKNTKPYHVDNISYTDTVETIQNVILMIGDGMGLNVVQAAWAANKGNLYINHAPFVGMMATTCSDSTITDSAAAGTAMSTGSKTKRGYIGVDENGNSLKSICEYANNANKSTGVISTCRIYDATPATFSVENIDRNKSEEIAVSFINSNIDFLLGGGLEAFNQRKDNKNLLPNLEKKGYSIVRNINEIKNDKDKIFAFLADHDLPPAKTRGDMLWKGTEAALNFLAKNKNGFFLMVESAMIDDYGHANKLANMMEETLDFDRTIGKVYQWTLKHPNTLVIVTADHATGGLTLLGGNLKQAEIIANYSSGDHDGVLVPVYAFGAGAIHFAGTYDNTDLFKKIKKLMGI